jgi:hypothetical protein
LGPSEGADLKHWTISQVSWEEPTLLGPSEGANLKHRTAPHLCLESLFSWVPYERKGICDNSGEQDNGAFSLNFQQTFLRQERFVATACNHIESINPILICSVTCRECLLVTRCEGDMMMDTYRHTVRDVCLFRDSNRARDTDLTTAARFSSQMGCSMSTVACHAQCSLGFHQVRTGSDYILNHRVTN